MCVVERIGVLMILVLFVSFVISTIDSPLASVALVPMLVVVIALPIVFLVVAIRMALGRGVRSKLGWAMLIASALLVGSIIVHFVFWLDALAPISLLVWVFAMVVIGSIGVRSNVREALYAWFMIVFFVLVIAIGMTNMV